MQLTKKLVRIGLLAWGLAPALMAITVGAAPSDAVEVDAFGNSAADTPPAVFSVDALLGSLWPDEALNLGAALALVEPPTARPDNAAALRFAALGPTRVPLLHHLFGLLPRVESHGPTARALNRLIALLAAVGADVNAKAPNPGEPSLLYKAVFMREMHLAAAFVAAGAKPQKRDPDSLLSKLATVPCDVVPFSKLLLHADTALADPAMAKRFEGVNGERGTPPRHHKHTGSINFHTRILRQVFYFDLSST